MHKQGFLVKQGGKVKSWKKRLFVLSTEGLSYYKTEQVVTVLINNRVRLECSLYFDFISLFCTAYSNTAS